MKILYRGKHWWGKLVSRGQTLFSRRGVIACSISAPREKESGMVEGSDTSQNSVRDFEIPDFRVGFQISKKDFRFLRFCCGTVNEVVKTQMKVNVNLRVNPKTKKVVKIILTARIYRTSRRSTLGSR